MSAFYKFVIAGDPPITVDILEDEPKEKISVGDVVRFRSESLGWKEGWVKEVNDDDPQSDPETQPRFIVLVEEI